MSRGALSDRVVHPDLSWSAEPDNVDVGRANRGSGRDLFVAVLGGAVAIAVVYALLVDRQPAPVVPNAAAATQDAVSATSGRRVVAAKADRRQLVDIAFICGDETVASPAGDALGRSWSAIIDEQLDRTTYLIHSHAPSSAETGSATAGEPASLLDQIDATVSSTTSIVVFSVSADGAAASAVIAWGRAALARIAALAPAARVLMIGPWSTSAPSSQTVADIDAGLQLAATAAGAQFVDPAAEGWFQGTDAALIGTDNGRLTDAGQAYVAAEVAPRVRALFPSA